VKIPRPFPGTRYGIDLANELTTFMMVLTGYGALIATGEMGAIHTTILTVGIIISLFWDEKARPLGSYFWNALVLGFLGFSLVEWFYLEGGFVKAVVHFLGYVQMVRMLSRTGDRDTLWMHLLSFLQLSAAAILTLSMAFLVFFFLYTLMGTWSLIIFTIKREAGRAKADPGPEVSSPSFFAASGLVAFSIFAVAMMVFFIIPRLGAGFFGWAYRGSRHVTGFGETVNIGDVGRIKSDRTTVMRVSITGETTPRPVLYWRGNVLDAFDGKSWTSAFAGSRIIYPDSEGVFRVRREYDNEEVEQEIYLEPIDSTVLFAASQPASFSLKAQGSLRIDVLGRMAGIVGHGSGFWSLPISGPIQDRIRYWATSDLREPDPETLRQAPDYTPPSIRVAFLALPDLDPRISDLARRITRNQRTNYDKAVAVRDYLLNNYGYSLKQPEKAPDDPLTYFLFERREGYCEHFATAMAVLLRLVGVPTRMVNGFQRGEWNDVDHYYRVRQSDAHSWVEVYFNGVGWVLFDATPSASITYNQTSGLISRIDLFLDTWRYRWNRYIVDYNFDDQAQTTLRVRDRGAEVGSRFYRQLSLLLKNARERAPNSAIAVVILLAAIIAVIFWLRRGRRGLRRHKDIRERIPDSEARRIYLKTIRRLEKKGLGRQPSLTPAEHAKWVIKRKGPDYRSLEEMASLFGKLRFSGVPQSPQEIEKMKNISKSIGELR